MNSLQSSSEEIFRRLLDESSALLAAPQDAGIAFPDDDLHREILLPLLPAMLGDEAIRQHWHEQAATGFLARLTRHLQDAEPAPRWQPGDFEIHVTASYSAGADAKALADTLLSEDSLREMAAALMNQILDAVWPKIALAAVEIAAVPVAEVAEEVAPILEMPVAEPRVKIAAAWKTMPTFTQLPWHAAMFAHRPKWKTVRTARENPISGTKIWRGKIGARDWSHSYPLA